MGYSSIGKKPFERASSSSHPHIINNPKVKRALDALELLPKAEDVAFVKNRCIPLILEKQNTISNFVAIDGSYTEIKIRAEFPSSLIHFFQFGALSVNLDDLKTLNKSIHIAPEDMENLKKSIARLTLVLPAKGMCGKGMPSRQQTIRAWIYNFLATETLDKNNTSLLDTLRWFVFKHYKQDKRTEADMVLELINPYDSNENDIKLREDQMRSDCTFILPSTNEPVYLTDIFRFDDVIEDENNVIGICGYLVGIIEHIMAIHIIRNFLMYKPEALANTLFFMDRPTVFFGQSKQLHVLMLDFIKWFFDNQYKIYWVGTEKSGAFFDHATEIQNIMPQCSFLILDDSYIYKYISPGRERLNRSYADTSYYGHKVIFKASNGQVYVISIPVPVLKKEPKLHDLPHLQAILTQIDGLCCDMYSSSLLPIVLINKLVSMSTQTSGTILKSFAKASVR